MLISASFFWSNALNAFMFGHGPMTPTLLDVMILTGLNINASDMSFGLLEKASFKIEKKHRQMERIHQQEYENWISIYQVAHCISQHMA